MKERQGRSRALTSKFNSVDPLPVPARPRPPHGVRPGRDESEVAEVEAREKVDDGAPGSFQEVEDHFRTFLLLFI